MTLAATPLIALEAVALDTETTGLDPSSARLIEIGAVAIRGGAIDEGDVFQRLVDPGVPIPPQSSAIHGIDAAELAGAETFAAVKATFDAYRRERVVVGHNIGFDLAVMKRECALAGLPFSAPLALDVRLLAQLSLPHLAGYGLDQLLARFGIAPDTRHRALPDARAAGQIFLALVPELRGRGIRTLGEAIQACGRLTSVVNEQARAGWLEPVRLGEGSATLDRLDAYPFRHRVSDVMSSPPQVLPGEATVADGVALMTEQRLSSVFVSGGGRLIDGIVTERDVMRLIARHGAGALAEPLAAHASRPLETVGADDFVYRAIGRMARRNVRHLGVVDAFGEVVGALSARDLLRLRASEAHILGDAIEAASDVPQLAAAWAGAPKMAAGLVAEGVPARDVAAVVSSEICELTRKAAVLAERALVEGGAGPAPAPFAVLVLGSAGRGESLLAPDQDNAVIWEDTANEAAADAWFARFGARLADMLDAVGIPYCKGGVMAREPAFRGALSTWRRRIDGWIAKTRPEDLLAVDIFFDFRAVAGDMALAERLRGEALAAAARTPTLAKLLAAELEGWGPPLGMFGGWQLVNGRVDLKRGGVFPIVAAARCLKLRHGLGGASTPERLAAAREAALGSPQDLIALDTAHGLVLDALLRQQLADIASGHPPSNLVDPALLGKASAERLRSSLAALKTVPELVRDLLFR
jgi:CBS domain-containing protein